MIAIRINRGKGFESYKSLPYSQITDVMRSYAKAISRFHGNNAVSLTDDKEISIIYKKGERVAEFQNNKLIFWRNVK